MDDFIINDDDANAELTVGIDGNKISIHIEQDSRAFSFIRLTPEQAHQLSEYLNVFARNIDYVKMMNKDLGIEEKP